METTPYQRKAQYYETDQMGIIHHSNYIRWFEEARIHWLEQVGLPFEILEAAGVGVPVLGVECQYKSMVRFGDVVEIHIQMPLLTRLRMTVTYQVVDKKTGELKTTGETRHCFINRDGRPVSLEKAYPEYYANLVKYRAQADKTAE